MSDMKLDPKRGWVPKFGHAMVSPVLDSEPKASGGGYVGQTYQIDSIEDSRQLAEIIHGGSLTHSGAVVNEESAMRVATMFRCVRLIADTIGTLPFKVKRKEGDSRFDATDHPVYDLLHRSPNDDLSPFEFMRMLTEQMLLQGNGYALKVKSRGKIIALLPLDPYRVEPKKLKTGEIVYQYFKDNGGAIVLPSDDVFHLRGFSKDGVKGLSVIGKAREAIAMSLTTEAHGAKVFKNGTHVGSVLETDNKLSDQAFNRLKQDMDDRTGTENAGKNMILEEGLTYRPIGMSQADAEFIETRKLTSNEICKFFGVPPHMVGDVDKSTSWGKGIEEQTIGFVTYTLQPYVVHCQQRADKSLLSKQETDLYTDMDLKSLLRGDLKTRFEVYKGMVQFGIYSANEVRAMEDMNPRTDGAGDEYYDPPNYAGRGQEKENDEQDIAKT